jgi:FlaA1/EpsC-like NDP-sugar epimerase
MRMKLLITGGAGSIGSEVVRHYVAQGHDVRVLDISEEGLWSLKSELPQVETLLGDVQSLDDVRTAVNGCSVVVHAAALKHVDLCERSPAVAQRVNVDGTANVCICADLAGAKLVFISTDKAINPVSVMGQTKLKAESIALGCGANAVRFGNVIGTKGSLLPHVIRCSKLGMPIKLTHPEMTRWFMQVEEAVALIQEAVDSQEHGKVFTPVNPRACLISRFIEQCRQTFAPTLRVEQGEIRPGERLHEPMQLRNGEIVTSDDCKYWMTWPELYLLVGRGHYSMKRGAA